MKSAMKRNSLSSRLITGATLLLVTGVLVGVAGAATLSDSRVLTVEAGVHKLLRQPGAVKRVAVGDPEIADVTVLNGREVLVTGRKPGITSLLIWPKDGAAAQEYRLRVGPATDPLKAKLVDPETAGTKADAEDGLTGSVPNLLAHRRAKVGAAVEAKRSIGGDKPVTVQDRSSVDLETQVMTEVKIVEVKRNTLKQVGFNFLKNSANTRAGLFTPGAGSQTASGVGTSGIPSPISDAFNLVIGNPADGLLGVLSLLEGKGLARTYAEPTLTAMSGQTASFLAGGEFPVPVPQGGSNNGSITIQYREFGVRLSLTPTVLSRDRIALKVAPEVSDLDFSSGITIGGVAVPSLLVRRTDTTVELGDGESFVISGLVSNNLISNVDKVPWIGDLPILGGFFKNSSVDREQKELVMVVTPRLVRPLSRDARRPALPGAGTDAYKPSFAELMFFETGKYDNQAFGFSK